MRPAVGRAIPHPTGALALFLAVAAIATSIVLALFPIAQRWSGDVRLFEHYSAEVFSGSFGSTPFLTWYPPLSLVPLGLPRLVGDGPMYAFALGVEMALVAAIGVPLVARLAPETGRRSATWLYAALVLVATALVAWRYDLVPAVLTLAAVWAASERRWWLAGLLIGVAAGLKLYAVILVPVVAIVAWRSDGLRAAIGAVGFAGLAGIVAVAPYAFFPGVTPFDLLAFTAARPLQVESIPGDVIALLAAVGVGEAPLAYGSGSFNVHGAAATSALAALRIVQPIVLLVSLGAVAAAAWRGAISARWLALMMAVVILGLLVSNRVLSPQYLVWILPVVPLLARPVRGLLAAAIVLSVVVFPWWYSALVELDPVPLLVILVRNAILIAAWSAGIWLLLRGPGDRTEPRLA